MTRTSFLAFLFSLSFITSGCNFLGGESSVSTEKKEFSKACGLNCKNGADAQNFAGLLKWAIGALQFTKGQSDPDSGNKRQTFTFQNENGKIVIRNSDGGIVPGPYKIIKTDNQNYVVVEITNLLMSKNGSSISGQILFADPKLINGELADPATLCPTSILSDLPNGQALMLYTKYDPGLIGLSEVDEAKAFVTVAKLLVNNSQKDIQLISDQDSNSPTRINLYEHDYSPGDNSLFINLPAEAAGSTIPTFGSGMAFYGQPGSNRLEVPVLSSTPQELAETGF